MASRLLRSVHGQLLEKYDLVPSRGISLAAATVQGLILTVSHKEQIGELYPKVLETLVYGACRELFEQGHIFPEADECASRHRGNEHF